MRSALDNVDLRDSVDDDKPKKPYSNVKSSRSQINGSGHVSPFTSPRGVQSPSSDRRSPLVDRSSPRERRRSNNESPRVTTPKLRQSPRSRSGTGTRASPGIGKTRESPVLSRGHSPRSVRSQQESPGGSKSPTRSHQASPKTSRSQQESPRTSRSQQGSPVKSNQGSPRTSGSPQESPKTGRSTRMSPRTNMRSPEESFHSSRSHTPRSIKSPLVTPRAELITAGSARSSSGIKGMPMLKMTSRKKRNCKNKITFNWQITASFNC